MQGFWLALQFLTRLPAPQAGEPAERQLGRAALYYPLIGAIIGGLLYGLAQLGAAQPPLLMAALLLLLWVGVTGALHLDGLADMADAWVGGHGDAERTLAIMKDPASGPMGVAAVVVLLLLKFAAIASLLPGGLGWLIFSPILGRAVVLLLFLSTPYARSGGLGHPIARHLPRLPAVLVALTAVLLPFAIFGWPLPLIILAAVAAVVVLYRRALLRRLGGWTGDGAGALIELTETVVLLGAVLGQ
jgi:adenosylcobinamide-GDP ribazoletransferase